MQHQTLLHKSPIDFEQFTQAEQERLIELMTELLCLTLAAKDADDQRVEDAELIGLTA